MSTPFVGEIRLMPYRRTPSGWFFCDGSLKQISIYEQLYTLLGTTYGGDGRNTFAVPDLRGSVPLHNGTGPGLTARTLGEVGGAEDVTLLTSQMPSHNHPALAATGAATSTLPTNAILSAGIVGEPYYAQNVSTATTLQLTPSMIGNTGGNQPHENCAPTLTLQYCIAYLGIYPSRG